MAKISFVLGLYTVFFSLVSTAVGEEVLITDIFTVQSGSNGGCDSRMGTLDQWHEESINSLDVAITATQNWLNDMRVRQSMDFFFGLNSYTSYTDAQGTVTAIEQNIQYVLNFFNREKDSTGTPRYSKVDYWLFCDSNFLTEKKRTDTAQDKDGKEILDKDKNKVSIEKIPKYLEELNKPKSNNKPWWAGDKAKGLNGYYFTDAGNAYCSDARNLGGTAAINIQNPDRVSQTAAIILCPNAFNGVPNKDPPPVPNSYREANLLLKDGYNLGDALPKSTTLVHEMFHALRGTAFLETPDEEYKIMKAINMASGDPGKAQRNPESYVFYIAHMFHLFGKPDGNEPWSIPKNWDFHIIDGGATKGDKKDMVIGAKVPGPADVDPDSD
ncbi:hypothetical protein V8F06_010027 [Rhypophila decipiens]